jgi:hypothetical protein
MLKGIRSLTVLVFVAYFVSMIAGPSYAWKGIDNGIIYDVNMRQIGEYSVNNMVKEKTYIFSIISHNGSIEVHELSAVLPGNFKLNDYYVDTGLLNGRYISNVFIIESPKDVGEYAFKFNGKDMPGNNINFSVPIKVVDKETSDDAIGMGEGMGGLVIVGGLLAALLFVLVVTGRVNIK